MRATCLVAAAVAVSFAAATPAAQTPPARPESSQTAARDTRTRRTETTTIRGRVMTTDRPAQAIRRALVKATSTADSRQWRAATTDAAGRYEILNLRPGRYTLIVYKATFITRSFGQRAADEPGKTIDVTDGQVLEGVDVALPRAAAILGRVTDERGEPLESVIASAWQIRFVNGRRQMVAAGLPAQRTMRGVTASAASCPAATT